MSETGASIEVGTRITPVRHDVDQGVIDAWAEVSGDFNPLHVEPTYAATTRFKGTIAHGHLSLAWLSGMMLAWRGPAWLRGGELAGVRFKAPVRPGRRVRCEGEVVEVVSGIGEARCEVRVVDEADGTVCAVGSALVPREDATLNQEG